MKYLLFYLNFWICWIDKIIWQEDIFYYYILPYSPFVKSINIYTLLESEISMRIHILKWKQKNINITNQQNVYCTTFVVGTTEWCYQITTYLYIIPMYNSLLRIMLFKMWYIIFIEFYSSMKPNRFFFVLNKRYIFPCFYSYIFFTWKYNLLIKAFSSFFLSFQIII